ncbi:MAG: hypothetical protein KatS3mg092_0426 [Patescibacteria group bacterium]|nr:MAG: hypothetical protein KatS3mg092_0426 [Patescibacteria group bacterium]
MQFITTVTQKGQITIPKSIRTFLGIKEYDKVSIEVEKEFIKIKPTEDIIVLAGKLKPSFKKNILKAREEMEKNYQRF